MNNMLSPVYLNYYIICLKFIYALFYLLRISSMVRMLQRHLGAPLAKGVRDGGPPGGPLLTWYSFPTLEALAEASVEELKQLG